MRKLAHAEALTQDITDHSCDLLVYQAINPPADVEGFLLRKEGRGFRVALEHHYDLESPRVAKLCFDRLCNRLIHHLAFDVRRHAAGDDLELLVTDTEHRSTFLGIPLEAYIALVLEAHYDEIRWVGVDDNSKRLRQRQRPPY